MRAVVVGVAALVAISCGCTSQSLPPNLACDAGCTPPIGVVSVSASPDAGAACAPSMTDSVCVQCAKASCCTALTSCSESMGCTCEAMCLDSACISSCQQFPSGAAPLAQLNACLGTACRSCTELGVGDSCAAAQGPCETGLTCNGLWCSKPCSSSTGCVGLGASGANALGEQSACVGTATSGDVCFPGCALSSNDCAPFPGTACFSTTSVDGVTVAICGTVPDAGAD